MESRNLGHSFAPGDFLAYSEGARRESGYDPDLQVAVGKKHAVEMGCPVTTGIFTWITARASEELDAKRAGSGAPYWRILKSDGSLNPKFPGGIERQAKRLAKEGVTSEKYGVKTRVVGLEEIRYHF